MSYTKQVLQQTRKFQTQIYYGLSETALKLRYGNHKKTFNNIKYQTDKNYQTNIGI